MKKLLISLVLFPAFAWAQLAVFISTDWLQNHLEDENLYIVDLSDGMQYMRFHIPGARQVDYSWLIRPTKNGLQFSGGAQYMQKVLSQLGIKPDDTVIIYDDTADLNGARLFWELKKLGHANVALLNGGSVKWILEQRKVTQHPAPFAKSIYLSAHPDSRRYTANKQDVLAAIKDPKTLLLDVRTLEEYVGTPKDPRSGHIPTALHFEWSQAVDFAHGFTEKNRDTLLKQLAMLGLKDRHQPIIVYCHTGHRAARMFATLLNLGFDHVKVYDGSMQAWRLDKTLPVRRGPKP